MKLFPRALSTFPHWSLLFYFTLSRPSTNLLSAFPSLFSPPRRMSPATVFTEWPNWVHFVGLAREENLLLVGNLQESRTQSLSCNICSNLDQSSSSKNCLNVTLGLWICLSERVGCAALNGVRRLTWLDELAASSRDLLFAILPLFFEVNEREGKLAPLRIGLQSSGHWDEVLLALFHSHLTFGTLFIVRTLFVAPKGWPKDVCRVAELAFGSQTKRDWSWAESFSSALNFSTKLELLIRKNGRLNWVLGRRKRKLTTNH